MPFQVSDTSTSRPGDRRGHFAWWCARACGLLSLLVVVACVDRTTPQSPSDRPRAPGASASAARTEAPDSTPGALLTVLVRRLTASGPGDPIAGARAELYAFVARTTGDSVAWTRKLVARAVSTHEGLLRVRDVPPGRYLLSVRCPAEELGTAVGVDVSFPAVEVPVALECTKANRSRGNPARWRPPSDGRDRWGELSRLRPRAPPSRRADRRLR